VASSGDTGSNTRKLLQQPEMLAAKIREEAAELADAVDEEAIVAEAADLLYFLLVKATSAGVGLDEVQAELDTRERRVTRRPMLAKELPT
jgi:phosphoribosyl-ATP pyrophosphohydrolase/phosphoribosyl-AMP cyclohydrolase/histidinol dehydrogenase